MATLWLFPLIAFAMLGLLLVGNEIRLRRYRRRGQ